MKDTLTLMELLAVVVKRGKALLATALVFAILLGGFQTYQQIQKANAPENSSAAIEKRYQEALDAYEEKKADLEQQLADTQKDLTIKEEYLENSMSLKIDPYHEVRTVMYLSVVDVDENAFQQVFLQENTPVEFLISKIQSHYQILWNTTDLTDIVDLPAYQNTEHKYLSEILRITNEGNGLFRIQADSNSEEDSLALANCLYEWLVKQNTLVSDSSYAHSLIMLTNNTKEIINEGLVDDKRSIEDSIVVLEEEIVALNEQIASLKAPQKEAGYSASTIAKSVAKFAALGAFVGLVLACAFIFVMAIISNLLENSYQLEQGLSIPFFGSLAGNKGAFNKLANKISHERVWCDQEQALDCIKEKSQFCLQGAEKVLLLSTLPLDQETAEIQELIRALSGNDHKVRFIGNAGQNASAIASLSDCDKVVLAERAGKSSLVSIKNVTETVKAFDKTVSGFVMI